jgi:hypothetical protein
VKCPEMSKVRIAHPEFIYNKIFMYLDPRCKLIANSRKDGSSNWGGRGKGEVKKSILVTDGEPETIIETGELSNLALV